MIIVNNTTIENLIQLSNDLEIIPIRSGEYTAKYKGNYLHSKYDPVKEADNITQIPNPANTSFIFIFGLGLAYHVRSVMQKMKNYPCTVFVFEKNVEIVLAAKKLGYLDFLNNPEFILICGDDAEKDFYSLSERLSIDEMKGYRTIHLASAVKLDKEFYDRILHSINEVLSAKFMDSFTRFELERKWIKNTIENSYAIFKNSLQINSCVKPDEAALVISAGPSLMHYLSAIREAQKNMTLFVVDTALGTLLEADIIPDYVVSLDAQIHNEKDFYGVDRLINILKLVCGVSVYPGVKKFGKELYFFAVPGESRMVPALEELMGFPIEKIDTEISVSYTAIHLAIISGFQTVFLAGQDLAYTGGITHASGCPAYNKFLYESNRFSPLINNFQNIINRRKTYKLNTLTVDIVMDKLAQRLEELIERKNVNVFNLSKGRRIKGTEILLAEDFTHIASGFSKSQSEFIARKTSSVSALLSYFNSLLHELVNFKEKLRNINIADTDMLFKWKSEIEFKYTFLTSYFRQDDLYFKRKQDEDPEKITTFYLLSIINRISSLEKSIRRAISSLKSAD